MHVDHTRLLVRNFAETFRFYRDIMGLTVTWGDEYDSYAAFTDRADKEVTLALFRRSAMAEVVGTADLPVDTLGQDRTMIIIAVEDIDTACDCLTAQGTQLLRAPRDFPDWGIRSAYLRDPDGNLIELYSALPADRCSAALHEAARRYGRG